ncbi:MAG: alpha/beta hydrolase, partial [Verrucomicrobiota bacterium]
AEKGYVAISVNYRLYPEVGILDCIADVKTAVRWFRAQAEDFGVDPERIGAFGNSAGAHLVSLLGLTTKEVGLEGDGPYQEYPSHVQAVCAGATPSSFVRKEGDERPPHPAFTKGSGTIEERARRASPVTYVNDHSPPFLLIHAKDDRTVPFSQGQLLHDRLQESGRDVTFLVYETGGHGIVSGKQEETLPAMEAFFDEALKHKTLQGPLP